jgi:hypothetical protein
MGERFFASQSEKSPDEGVGFCPDEGDNPRLIAIKFSTMKKIIYFVLVAAFGVALATSCEPEAKNFDETLLYGEWTSVQSGVETVDLYNSDGTGSQRYPELGTYPQPFRWELEGDRLTVIHQTETRRVGGVYGRAEVVSAGAGENANLADGVSTRVSTRADIPFDYTVKTLTATTLVYVDDRGTTVTCTKL